MAQPVGQPAPIRGLIIDGVTGSGKTSVIAQLRPRLEEIWPDYTFLDEDETFGEFMAELHQEPKPPLKDLMRRIPASVQKMREAQHFLAERFHFSYFALLPAWQLYQKIDEQLAHQGVGTVVLAVPERGIAQRALRRVDRAQWAAGFTQLYGSEDAALSAIRESQARRLEALTLSDMPTLLIDTSEMNWSDYADQIVGFIIA